MGLKEPGLRIRKAPMPDLVDLHVHSNVSDGSLSPRDVVHHAAEVGLRAIALTDHDTVAGVPEALAAGAEFGVEVIPGTEIGTEFKGGACHILGYFIDPADPGLSDLLTEARDGRHTRNLQILARLNELGFRMSMADVVGNAPDAVLTRAHFAGAMLAAGYVKTWDEAFEKYLGSGKPAYVHRRHIDPADAFQAIHKAGGLAVLAHPRQLNCGTVETAAWIGKFAAQGLDGVETSSPDHTSNLARRYREAANACGLIETGGTDWHGSGHGGMHLGLGRGSMTLHYELVQKMKDRLAARGDQ
jgi:3',5'-nucleoside bisphosphate phosphatase